MSEQVICIDGRPPPKGWSSDAVTINEIYTIRGRDDRVPNFPGVLLHEVSTQDTCHITGLEIGFRADRFVPIKDENLDIFREMDRKIFKPKKVEV